MAVWTGQKTTPAVLAAAQEWKQRCFLADGSVFSSSHLWTKDNFLRLKELFVDHPIEGSQGFYEKLREQIGKATPEIAQLTAEAIWLLYLFVSGAVLPQTKRERIGEVWKLSGGELPESQLLNDNALTGVANPGAAFQVQIWRELGYLILLLVRWKSLQPDQQLQLLNPSDPWPFCNWVTSIEDGSTRAFRHMLLYLCYPEYFERCCSREHKQRIYVAFSAKLANGINPYAQEQTPCALDQAIFQIRLALQKEYETTELDFYREPLEVLWKESPGGQGERQMWIEKTIVQGRSDREEGPHALGKALWSPQKAKGGGDIYRFMRDVKTGDIVLHLTDNEGFTGISRAAGSAADFKGLEGTEWDKGPFYRVPLQDFVKLDPPLSREAFFRSPFKEKLTALIEAGGKNLFFNKEPNLNQGAYLTPAPPELVGILNDAYLTTSGKSLPIKIFPPVGGPPPTEQPNTPEGLHRFLTDEGLHFSEELVANYLLALRTKRFAILTGLSGTGKSQLAIAIAKYFEPKIPTSEVVRIPEGCEVIELRPYMFQHNRMTLPAIIRSQIKLPPPDEGTKGGGQLAVSYPGGKEMLAFWRDPDSKGNNLFFKGSFKEWFTTNLQPGQKLILQVVDGDAGQPDSLKISVSETEVRSKLLCNNCVVPVRPDWTDNRGLLGYFNPLTNRYSIEPLLKLLLKAKDEMSAADSEHRPPHPFFAILDEMNLAHVEQYFSDFLSCLESGKPLNLHQEQEIESGANEDDVVVPRELQIPENVYFTGTVNVDETTYMFSPKVLDRAFTIELQDVDLEGFGNTESLSNAQGELSLASLPKLAAPKKPDISDWKAFGELLGGELRQTIVDLNELLTPYTLHFGYRVATEIASFADIASRHTDGDADTLWTVLDLAILEKVLPKFHGTQEELDEPLRTLFTFAKSGTKGLAPLSWEEIRDGWRYQDNRLKPMSAEVVEPKFPRTAAKVWLMLRRLHQQGFTAFIS